MKCQSLFSGKIKKLFQILSLFFFYNFFLPSNLDNLFFFFFFPVLIKMHSLTRSCISDNSSLTLLFPFRMLYTLGRFYTIFTRETTFLPFYFPAHQALSKKGLTLKGKNLLPMGANSFLLE